MNSVCIASDPQSHANTKGLYEAAAEILGMDEAAFNNRFGHTSMAWRGLHHLQRNATIVMNNLRNNNASGRSICIEMGKKGDNNGTLEYKRSARQRF